MENTGRKQLEYFDSIRDTLEIWGVDTKHDGLLEGVSPYK